ncbi:MAG: hypothetical protein GY862_07790 [Gammaproteobacteria bacterium]|nr:hypothetical protein [Gammaproteobacteria bacterium]
MLPRFVPRIPGFSGEFGVPKPVYRGWKPLRQRFRRIGMACRPESQPNAEVQQRMMLLRIITVQLTIGTFATGCPTVHAHGFMPFLSLPLYFVKNTAIMLSVFIKIIRLIPAIG